MRAFGKGKLAPYMGLHCKTRSFYNLTRVTGFHGVMIHMDEAPERTAAGPAAWAALTEVIARTGHLRHLLKIHKNLALKNVLLPAVPAV